MAPLGLLKAPDPIGSGAPGATSFLFPYSGTSNYERVSFEVGLANGKSMKEVIRDLGVSEQTYYRWRREYGGMKTSQAKRLKELEKENQRLKRAVADLTVDNMILKEASKGNF